MREKTAKEEGEKMSEKGSIGVKRSDREHVFHPVTNPQEVFEKGSMILETGKGPFVYDIDGKEYLDGMAGLWNVNIGYGRRELAEVAKAQMEKIAFAPLFWGRGNITSAELAEKLSTLLPKNLSRFHFTSGGSESNESAFKIARYYWRLKGENEKCTIIACSRGYHGVSMGALGATGLPQFVEPFGIRPPGYAHIPSPYCYHCPFDKKYPECQIACAQELKNLINETGSDKIAAFIMEPVEGAGGVIVPPPEYLPTVWKICKENDVLLIIDEVITGFGRTGSMFATGRYDFVPDMISMAKGITSGYIPLGAVAVSEDIYQEITRTNRIFFHGFTYSGHPVACAVALRNIEIIEKESLCENAVAQGEYLRKIMHQVLGNHPHVGGFRLVGLLGAFEVVQDKDKNSAFPAQEKMGEKVGKAAGEAGLIVRPIGDIIAFAPPLILDKNHVEEIVARLQTAVLKVFSS